MEQSLADVLLPRGSSNKPAKVSSGRQMSFTTNWFPSQLKQKCRQIHQYAISLTPQIPEDSGKLRSKIMWSIKPQLYKLIGYISGEGLIVSGKLKLTKPQILLSQFEFDGKAYKYEVLIKHTNAIYAEDFIDNNPTKSCAVRNVINTNAKNTLRALGLCELKRGEYYERKEKSKEQNIYVLEGYSITVIPSLKLQFYMQIDLTSRVLKSQNFNQTLKLCKKQMSVELINMKFGGKRSVITNYGDMKTYSIIEVDYTKSPKDKFQIQKGMVSFIDYYRDNYKEKINDDKQPLLKVKSNRKKRFQKAETKQNEEQFIYLIPQLVSLSGLDEQERANRHLTQSLAKSTNKTPQNIMKGAGDMINKLNKQKQLMFDIKNQPLVLKGYELDQPCITMRNRKVQQFRSTNFLVRQVQSPCSYNNLAICYSIRKDKQDMKADDVFADKALDLLQSCGQKLGIKLNKDPIWIPVSYQKQPSAQDWIDQLQDQCFTKGCKPEMIVFLLGRREEEFYDEIKKYTIEVLKTPSQFIKKDNVDSRNDPRKMKNIADKIMIQMNAKMGHPIWITSNSHPYWKDNSVMVGGIAMSKGKKGIYLSFVGTKNRNLNEYYNDCQMITSKEQLSVVFFKDIYVKWIRSYFDKNNKCLPNCIVIFREGLNDKQAKITLQFEINGLLQAIKQVEKNTKQQFKPSIVEMLVNKKSNTHLFINRNSGKGDPIYKNPFSGSIVYQQLSIEGYKQFHLVSNEVKQGGSCTPVVYRVGYEKGTIPFDALGQLAYLQCYQYANWSGAIKIPGVLQYANKMSKLHSQIGVTSPLSKQLKEKTYCL